VGLSLTVALKNFLAAERLDGCDKYFCSVCHGLEEAERRHSFTELPELLAVHLKLFDSYGQDGGSGGRARVECPAVLSVEQISTGGGGNNATVVQYRLRAAVLHKGNSVRPDPPPPCRSGPFCHR
jgi:ubiquitin C-terminal hydrolase